MDDIIDFFIELFGELLGEILGNIKNPSKRKWALSVFYSVFWLGITSFLTYFAVSLKKENNLTGAIVVGMIAVMIFLLLGFFIIHGHRQNWKKH